MAIIEGRLFCTPRRCTGFQTIDDDTSHSMQRGPLAYVTAKRCRTTVQLVEVKFRRHLVQPEASSSDTIRPATASTTIVDWIMTCFAVVAYLVLLIEVPPFFVGRCHQKNDEDRQNGS